MAITIPYNFSFVVYGEISDWGSLIWKVEKHIIFSVAKRTASYTMSKVKNFFSRKQNQSIEDDDKSELSSEDIIKLQIEREQEQALEFLGIVPKKL